MARPGFTKAIVLKAAPGEKPLTGIEKDAPFDFEVNWIPEKPWITLLPWNTSTISDTLGFSVQILRCSGAGATNLGFNNRLAPLLTNGFVDAPGFGTVTPYTELLMGDSVVMRCDRKDLHLGQLMILIQYINETLKDAASYEFPNMPKEVQDSIKAEVKNKLNPEAFLAYFEERCDQMDAATTDSCAACGGSGKDGQELRLCARCKETRYCDRDCQKGHWKQHKKACKAAVESQSKAAKASGST